MAPRSPYTGTYRKLILAFDVGTTYSGISYTILDPGREPEIKPVTRFPSGAQVGGGAKVPTVIYYDTDGVPRAIGAETEKEGFGAIAEEKQWFKAEWFKLHLRPKTQTTAYISDDIPPLPKGKTAVDAIADFLKYLYQCARNYIEETHVDGVGLMSSGKVEFILSHPNAWEGAQQTLMRNAAIQAGLIADTPEDRRRISFISEGEASLNFCLDENLINKSIQQGEGVTIVDAGGGTLDVSTYARKSDSTYEFEETAVTQCYFKGSVFVTRAASKHLNELLQGTRFEEDIPFIVEKFDKTTKLAFRNPNDPQYIKFGGARERDPDLGIWAGQLKLDGNAIANFFEPSVECIVSAVKEQQRTSSRKISTVFLVGGFAASDYLFARVQEQLQPSGFIVRRPDAHLNKAVPDGAIAHSLHPRVSTRVAKYSYGVVCRILYDPSNVEHVRRSDRQIQFLDGTIGMPDSFSTILRKGTRVSETQEFREPFSKEALNKSGLSRKSTTFITCYGGCLPCPEFKDQDPENFHKVFEVHADLSNMIDSLSPRVGAQGVSYYEVDYDIIILFGATEFEAQYAWKEDGVERRGPAEIFYSTDVGY